MAESVRSEVDQRLRVVVDPDGRATAIQVDIETWHALMALVEDNADAEALREAAAAIELLARGERPPGWTSWEEFEAEIDALDQAGGLPT
jgi:hypothetical protein